MRSTSKSSPRSLVGSAPATSGIAGPTQRELKTRWSSRLRSISILVLLTLLNGQRANKQLTALILRGASSRRRESHALVVQPRPSHTTTATATLPPIFIVGQYKCGTT